MTIAAAAQWTAPFPKEQLLHTTTQAAEVLHLSRTTVYALINEGALRPVHVGRSCRISRAELERYVASLEEKQHGASLATDGERSASLDEARISRLDVA
jgi:excisionase family DNA binding protein